MITTKLAEEDSRKKGRWCILFDWLVLSFPIEYFDKGDVK
jgi:hypothetical protein